MCVFITTVFPSAIHLLIILETHLFGIHVGVFGVVDRILVLYLGWFCSAYSGVTELCIYLEPQHSSAPPEHLTQQGGLITYLRRI